MITNYRQSWQGSKPCFWYREDESQSLKRISTPEAIRLWRDKKIDFPKSVLDYFRSDKSEFVIDSEIVFFNKIDFDQRLGKSNQARMYIISYFLNLFYGDEPSMKKVKIQLEKVKEFLIQENPPIEIIGDWHGFSVPAFHLRELIQKFQLQY